MTEAELAIRALRPPCKCGHSIADHTFVHPKWEQKVDDWESHKRLWEWTCAVPGKNSDTCECSIKYPPEEATE